MSRPVLPGHPTFQSYFGGKITRYGEFISTCRKNHPFLTLAEEPGLKNRRVSIIHILSERSLGIVKVPCKGGAVKFERRLCGLGAK